MPDSAIALLNLILVTAPFLIMTVCFLGFAALFFVVIYFFFKKSRSISTQVTQDLSQTSQDFFADMTSQLIPWETKALSDLSAYLEYSSRTRPGRINARGRIKSLDQPDASGWLAFELRIENFKGTLTLKSTQSDWQLNFLGLTARETQVEVEGLPLGTIQQALKTVLLLSSDNRQIGTYHQHRLLGGIGGLTNYAQTPYFGSVTLFGLFLAELNRNPILLKPLIGDKIAPPLVKDVIMDLTREGENWLVALVGWEILYRIVTK